MRLSCPYAPLSSWLTTESAEAVDFHFTSSVKPAILRGHGSDDQGLRYPLMPVRLTGVSGEPLLLLGGRKGTASVRPELAVRREVEPIAGVERELEPLHPGYLRVNPPGRFGQQGVECTPLL
ncbi:hypothetical protein QF035_000171 [Streptomyces umbrinus]|uniref:Uncharacterized protein n=1 Tax=Streptomyces umbrinus TaxID=67370 RepID=A0ABU0SGB1_9ACTN|nr:hypothetical protein [Streptomyces umbrinus]MDQ1022589.1 hypothetical protein [Streptomyces umbrinus]